MKNRDIPQFLLAAPMSGSGKTTISWALMECLTEQRYRVQPYKCGPDYIDTKFHTSVCGRPSVNLDTVMASRNHVKQLYASSVGDADICIIEGMMGLFDGYDREQGSSAEISRVLGLPVVLVVDARSMAYSAAALLSGFLHFRPDIEIIGVIFNRVGSERHASALKEICKEVGTTCFGYVFRNPECEQLFTSRYLGLDYSKSSSSKKRAKLSEEITSDIYLDKLLKATMRPAPVTMLPEPKATPNNEMCIAVARNDESFSFIYQEHLQILSRLGRVIFFDPEHDVLLPDDIDLLYLPGGYPEKHLRPLARNKKQLEAVKKYVECGGKVLAECGGMIYLAKTVKDELGNKYNMAGVLPIHISAAKEDRKLTLGYRQFEYNGMQLCGHEFHYSQETGGEHDLPSVAIVRNAKGDLVGTPVYRYKNVIASYTHLYWGEIDLLKLFE